MEFINVKELNAEQKSKPEVEAELLATHEKTIAEATEIVEPVIELKDEDVLSFLGKKLNRSIGSFSELELQEQKEELPEDVGAFLKYKKETGRGIGDFISLNRDFDSMDSDTLLKEFYSITQEGLDSEDIDSMVSELEFDEDIDLDSDIRKKKLAKKKALTEAKKFFNSQKDKYKLPLESSSAAMSEDEKNEFESYKEYTKNAKTAEEQNYRKREWFDQKSNELFGEEFKGFEFKVDDKTFKFSTGSANELKSSQSSPMNFINKFMDENGLIKDAEGYHKGLSVAMNPDKFAKFFYEQGKADATEGTMASIKNINMSERQVPQSVTTGGIKVKEVNADSGRGLKILSVKTK